jgi:RecA-family ATPase
LESAPKQVFSIREVVAADLGTYEDNHWFAHGILPVRGQCIIHGGMKSLKSFVVVDLARALATGTTFAGEYSYLKDEPSKVLMFQFEVPPFDFQQRILGTMVDMTIPERELFMDNFYVHRIADNQWSRLKAREDLADYVGHLADSVGAGVVIFDPVQRMTGKADINSASEMDLVLGTYENLQTAGFTVVYVHHNNKANHNIADPYSMSGTQRFGADVDSICSMYHGKACIPDENSERRKQRNFAWTLRNGAAPARSITVAPRPENQDQVKTTFGPPIVAISSDDDENY